MGRSLWQKHKQKHTELLVTGCYYCEHPPVEIQAEVKVSKKGIKYTRSGYKALYHIYKTMFDKAMTPNIIQPATDKDIQLIGGGQ